MLLLPLCALLGNFLADFIARKIQKTVRVKVLKQTQLKLELLDQF